MDAKATIRTFSEEKVLSGGATMRARGSWKAAPACMNTISKAASVPAGMDSGCS